MEFANLGQQIEYVIGRLLDLVGSLLPPEKRGLIDELPGTARQIIALEIYKQRDKSMDEILASFAADMGEHREMFETAISKMTQSDKDRLARIVRAVNQLLSA